jgi:hypothetical protein
LLAERVTMSPRPPRRAGSNQPACGAVVRPPRASQPSQTRAAGACDADGTAVNRSVEPHQELRNSVPAAATGTDPGVARSKLQRCSGRWHQAEEHLTMYREIDMRFWLEQAEAKPRELA